MKFSCRFNPGIGFDGLQKSVLDIRRSNRKYVKISRRKKLVVWAEIITFAP